MSKNNYFIGFWIVVVAGIMWSFDGIFRSEIRSGLPAINIVFWEHFIPLIVLVPLFLSRFKEVKTITKRDWVVFTLIALFTSVLGTLAYTAAFGLASFAIIVSLQRLQPIFAISSANLILKEKLSKNFLIWAGLAILGSFLLILPSPFSPFVGPSKDAFTGGLLALFAAICWGFGTTLGKLQLNKYSVGLALSIRFILASVFAFVLMFILAFGYQSLSQVLTFPLGASTVSFDLNFSQLQSLLFIVLITGVVPMFIYYYGLNKTQAKMATIGELAWPVSALIIDYFYNIQTKQFGFRPDLLSLYQILGLILILVSMNFISKDGEKSEK